ncbi:YbjN domain-containing protein [Marinobacterium sediminicola]|uniref:Sensory transduction regulator n=1 Tax=Marinobacterium sediminicola TaxID=518898 RepID=A0ABY1RWF5_9GAMM|nr:YbjN domain-containing protein [Marinobacterium sediminicola]ULG70324.1 YbjN domain-containing protein [Marinobacterium sediminicola]SMR69722.1 hypothetical protein SAMN04487964_101342 [Marinobacterium sediminicola]
MAINTAKIKQYLKEIDFNYEERDADTIVTGFSDDDGHQVVIAIRLMEDGEFLQMRTIKHLDDLVAQAEPEKRVELLKWMLNKNYTTKTGSWEYDPDDHDHHLSIGHVIEDGDLTCKQFLRMLGVMTSSASLIPEMKAVLGISEVAIDPVEQKRQELLAQLRALEEGAGI